MAARPRGVQSHDAGYGNRVSITIDRDLDKDLEQATSVTREKRSTVIRLALRAGLPLVLNSTLRGQPGNTEVRLDSADGLETASICDCGFVWVLQKSELSDGRGSVSWERTQAIKARLKETLRL